MAVELENVKPLPIEPYLNKTKNRIALVGVELEGAWIELPKGVQQLDHDGSVFGGRVPQGAKHVGELPIGPVVPAGIAALIKANHPHKVNSTCGMHVHMSFDVLWYYKILMIPEYQETVIHHLTEWAKAHGFNEKHHIWERLAGKSRFCQKKFWPDAQVAKKKKAFDQNEHGHRYTIIHYCGRPNLPTIECRVLPMMDKPKTAISAVQKLLDVTNACIYLLGPKNKKDKQEGKIELADGMVYEETTIETI